MKRTYLLHNVLPANVALLKRDIYLVLMHANRVPPHIFVCVNGKLFSLSVKGHLLNEDLDIYLRTIRKYKIETLFVKLFSPGILTMEQLLETITRITLSYPRVEPGLILPDGTRITCLTPVKDFCNSIYKTETKGVKFIFDLLPELEKQGVIGNSYHLNMERSLMADNDFALKTYTMFEVNENIYALNTHTV